MNTPWTLASCWQKNNQAYRWPSSKLTLNSLRGRISMEKKNCTSVHGLHLSTSAQLQYHIHCLSAWMSNRILQFLEREQNHFHYVRNGYPFIHRDPKQWRLQSTQTFFDQRPVEKPSSETLLRLAELVLMLNLQSKILSKTSKSSAVIPKLNLYFLYHHLPVSFKRDKNIGNFLVWSAFKSDNQLRSFISTRTQYKTCPFISNMVKNNMVKISGSNRFVKLTDHFTRVSVNAIYCITCTLCKKIYIAETRGEDWRTTFANTHEM